jgi:hypothetical protein
LSPTASIQDGGYDCLDYGSSYLFLDHRSTGWVVKSKGGFVPILFAAESEANAFRSAAKKHEAVCWMPSIESDLKNGYDAFVEWRNVQQPSGSGASSPPLDLDLYPDQVCLELTALDIEQSEEKGTVTIKMRGGKSNIMPSGSLDILTFDSVDKADEILPHLKNKTCLLSVTNKRGDRPFVAYPAY